MSDLQMKAWHIENLYEAEPDCQVVIYSEAAKLIDQKQARIAEYGMSAGHAHQKRCEANAARDELGFGKDDENVSPRDLRDAIKQIKQERDELATTVERLKLESESNYEKWQVKYQRLKDGLTLAACYECGTPVHELSPRSRCCMCEYGRANFNEKENDILREQLK